MDQAQHCELTRRLAAKFNRFLGQQLLRSPRISFSPYVLRDLRNPRAYKMSKSRPHGALLLSASQATIARQIQQAPTDSYQSLRYDPVQQPELANLLQIMAALQATSPEQIANTYQQSNYFQFKQALISNLQTELAALQVRQRQ